MFDAPTDEDITYPPRPCTALLVAFVIIDPFLACARSKVPCDERKSMLGE